MEIVVAEGSNTDLYSSEMAVRIALCGKGVNLAKAVAAAMKPEYDVTHVFLTTAAAQDGLPKLLSRQAIKPSSGIGSDADEPEAEAARAVIIGAAFSVDQVVQLRSIEGADSIPWFKASPDFVDRNKYAEGTVPPVSYIADRCKAAMQRTNVVSGSIEAVGAGLFDFWMRHVRRCLTVAVSVR